MYWWGKNDNLNNESMAHSVQFRTAGSGSDHNATNPYSEDDPRYYSFLRPALDAQPSASDSCPLCTPSKQWRNVASFSWSAELLHETPPHSVCRMQASYLSPWQFASEPEGGQSTVLLYDGSLKPPAG